MELGFDIYAMVEPKSEADLVALCKEALAELKIVNQTLDSLLGEPPAEDSQT
jgi:hypothetical protein